MSVSEKAFRAASAFAAVVVLATAPALATTYHVAAGTCSHGSGPGSDSNDGLSRATAFLTVQKCLNTMRAGDTCLIHTGTYVGDFECCGAGSTSPKAMNATAASPTRILGAPGDTAILNGTSGETVPNKDASPRTDRSTANVSTLSFWDAGGDGASYFEVGNLTINPGNGGMITASEGDHGYIHDVTATNLNTFVGLTWSPNGTLQPAENSGILYFYDTSDLFVDGVTISNGGVVKPYNFILLGPGERFHGRNISLSDMRGALERMRGYSGLWEFVKVRNYEPWQGDDGTFIGLYNSGPMAMRYIDVKEDANSETLQGYRYAAGHRATNSTKPVGIDVFSNWTYEDGNRVSDNWAVLGADSPGTGAGDQILTGIFNNAFVNSWNGITPWNGNPPSSACNVFNFSNNGYQNVSVPVVVSSSSNSNCYSTWGGTEAGRVTGTLGIDSSTHVPTSSSAAVVNAGRADSYGDAKVFPPPVGGGSVIDIGAYEYGAGNWPYDFQIQKTVTKNPATQTIRLCWSTSVSNCDFTFYWWDPYNNNAVTRPSPPSKFILEVDPDEGFHSGRTGVAPGFGAFFSTGVQSSSNRYYDVPAGTLVDGQSYYVRVITAINNVWSSSDTSGWATWSQGLYRFQVSSSGSGGGTPPSDVQNVHRTDTN